MKQTRAQKFGAALRNGREMRGFTLRELAPLLGIAPSHLSMIENGSREPGSDLIARMGQVLGEELPVLMASLGRLSAEAKAFLADSPAAIRLVERLAKAGLSDAEMDAMIGQIEGER